MTNTVKTMVLRSGITVLAKDYKEITMPVTYANMTQAQKRANSLRSEGWNAWVSASHPFLIVFATSQIGVPERCSND